MARRSCPYGYTYVYCTYNVILNSKTYTVRKRHASMDKEILHLPKVNSVQVFEQIKHSKLNFAVLGIYDC